MTDLLSRLLAGIERALPEAAQLRRELHRNPDVGGAEGPTRDRLVAALPHLAWTPTADTGAVGRLGPAGPAVALRGELDALPITEATGVAWASEKPGLMHACGHDVHLAGLWAFLVACADADLPVGVLPVLQPREEVVPSGAVDVLASGLLASNDARAMIGVHVQPRAAAGTISTGAGAVNAAFDIFQITIHGEPGHGAYPHVSIDPISTLASVIVGLNEIAARAIDPTHPHVITVGAVEGGSAANAIPASASCRGTIRSFSLTDRQVMMDAVRRLADGVAASRGARAEFTVSGGGPMLFNDPALVATVDPLIGASGVPLADPPFRSCGSDDFAAYGEVMPSLMMFVGVGGEASGVEVGLHHERFLPDEDALRRCAVAYACGYVGAASLLSGA